MANRIRRQEGDRSVPTPPPPSPKEVCDTRVWVRDQSVVYNPKNTFYKAEEIKELEYIEKKRINFQEIKVSRVIIELLL